MDRIIRCISSNGAVMAAAIDSTYLVATAQQIHQTSAVSTAAVGRLLTASSIMGTMLKKKNASVTLKINGGGPLGSIVAVADSGGNCRASIEHPGVELPLKPNGKLDVGAAVGNRGLLGVIRDDGEGTPYVSQVAVQTGEIAEDLTYYYATSEQVPTVCALGVLVDRSDLRRVLAGGLLIQALPGAQEADLARLEQNAAALRSVTTMLAEGMGIEEICREALSGFEMEILDTFPVAYTCPCNRQRLLRAVSSLKRGEILSLADKTGFAEAKCQYCGRVYRIGKEELERLVARSGPDL